MWETLLIRLASGSDPSAGSIGYCIQQTTRHEGHLGKDIAKLCTIDPRCQEKHLLLYIIPLRIATARADKRPHVKESHPRPCLYPDSVSDKRLRRPDPPHPLRIAPHPAGPRSRAARPLPPGRRQGRKGEIRRRQRSQRIRPQGRKRYKPSREVGPDRRHTRGQSQRHRQDRRPRSRTRTKRRPRGQPHPRRNRRPVSIRSPYRRPRSRSKSPQRRPPGRKRSRPPEV